MPLEACVLSASEDRVPSVFAAVSVTPSRTERGGNPVFVADLFGLLLGARSDGVCDACHYDGRDDGDDDSSC